MLVNHIFFSKKIKPGKITFCFRDRGRKYLTLKIYQINIISFVHKYFKLLIFKHFYHLLLFFSNSSTLITFQINVCDVLWRNNLCVWRWETETEKERETHRERWGGERKGRERIREYRNHFTRSQRWERSKTASFFFTGESEFINVLHLLSFFQ